MGFAGDGAQPAIRSCWTPTTKNTHCIVQTQGFVICARLIRVHDIPKREHSNTIYLPFDELVSEAAIDA